MSVGVVREAGNVSLVETVWVVGCFVAVASLQGAVVSSRVGVRRVRLMSRLVQARVCCSGYCVWLASTGSTVGYRIGDGVAPTAGLLALN